MFAPGVLTSCSQHELDCLQGFELLIRGTFDTPEDLDVFKQHWQVLAAHCKAHEPETLSYELLQSDREPQEILIYER